MIKFLSTAMLVLCLLSGLPSKAAAADIEFQDTGSGLWSDNANWIGGLIPGNNDRAMIRDETVVVDYTIPTLGALTLGFNDPLTGTTRLNITDGGYLTTIATVETVGSWDFIGGMNTGFTELNMTGASTYECLGYTIFNHHSTGLSTINIGPEALLYVHIDLYLWDGNSLTNLEGILRIDGGIVQGTGTHEIHIIDAGKLQIQASPFFTEQDAQNYINSGLVTGDNLEVSTVMVDSRSYVQIKGPGLGEAQNPFPEPGINHVDPAVVFSWDPPHSTPVGITYDVYLGLTSNSLSLVSPGQSGTSYNPEPDLSYMTDYYWRVDSIDPNGGNPIVYEGLEWTFSTGGQAWDPNPVNGVASVSPSSGLSWSGDSFTQSYDVYLGTDQQAVSNATTGSDEFQDNVSVPFYQPDLEGKTTYYWRIDQRDSEGSVILPGEIWSFTTIAPPLSCPEGDLDGNCKVNLYDFQILSQSLLDIAGSLGDIVGNDGVNQADFAVIAETWLEQVQIVNYLIITEFMASNNSNFATQLDGQEVYPDWIEFYNLNTVDAIEIGGWYLTDDGDDLTKWQFPDGVTIGPQNYLVIFASGQNDLDYPVVDSNGYLHTNFRLSQEGEYLALVMPDGATIVQEFNPAFPEQRTDISYGLYDSLLYYFTEPTPGAANHDVGAFEGLVADTKFSIDRGFYENPFTVTLSTQTQGAAIYYTTDGSEPTESSTEYSTPVSISTTTCLRAAAYKTDYLPTDVGTHSYIFLDDVLTQTKPPGYPDRWGDGEPGDPAGIDADYDMDTDVIGPGDLFGGIYANTIKDDLKAVPTISLVMNFEDFLGSEGFYMNTFLHGDYWERAVSVEYIDPNGGPEFQVNAGIRAHGYWSRRSEFPKHSMRLYFRNIYGPGKLNFPLFSDTPVESFDQLVLRANAHGSWIVPTADFRLRAQYLRDEFIRDVQHEMGWITPHGNFAHVYVNGLYWGLYNVVERVTGDFMAQYQGGEEEDYDVIKWEPEVPAAVAVDGNMDAWNEMISIAAGGLASDAAYQNLQAYLDMDNFIDYMIINLWSCNGDWLNNNWYAARKREAEGKFIFPCWDTEASMNTIDCNRHWYGTSNAIDLYNTPGYIYTQLWANAEFLLHFADHLHKHCFNGGVLTPARLDAVWMAGAAQIERALVGESARWGDGQLPSGEIPYTRDGAWMDEQNRLRFEYMSVSTGQNRTDIVLDQFRALNLYPQVVAPVFNQHGGEVSEGFELTMVSTLSTITTTLVPSGSEWLYLDNGSDQGSQGDGSSWFGHPNYVDSSWNSGNAELGYGDGDEATVVNCGPSSPTCDSNNYMTTYFRLHFNVIDPSIYESLTVHIRRDDGAVVFLNGEQIVLSNMPGTFDYLTPASGTVFSDETTFYPYPNVDPGLLVVGDNVLAVEIHQVLSNSSDISFDLIFEGEQLDAASSLPVYYTTDGSDPREYLTGNPLGTAYTNPVVINKSTHVKSRTLHNNEWSALNEAVFAVGPSEYLRISEIMYHPKGVVDPNEEFIELINTSNQTLNLNLVSFTGGVSFTFPSLDLLPGEYVLVVEDQAAFETKYGGGLNIAGQYTGKLNNAGEGIELEDAIGRTIQNFDYSDNWYLITDGRGFSLNIIDPNNPDPSSWGDKNSWRPSSTLGGTPGVEDSGGFLPVGSVVINEVLAHADTEPGDWIELHNTTISEINITGWFLSDNDMDLQKYEIGLDGNNQFIPANGYVVIEQLDDFGNAGDPGTHSPFALSENGERIYLTSGLGGEITGAYSVDEDFGASSADVSMGRHVKSAASGFDVDFVAMSSRTPGAANVSPHVGPVVISEIMYHPSDPDNNAEYVELVNISGVSVTLFDFTTNEPWKFVDDYKDATPGVEYFFPSGTPVTMVAGERILLVKNVVAFSDAFGTPGVQTFAWSTGSLSNAGERLQLSMPGDVDGQGVRQYIRVDRVKFSDGSHPEDYPDLPGDPWPTTPDGLGSSLDRITESSYGNDVGNWQAATPSPGGV